MPGSPQKPAPRWHHPSEVMKLHKLKVKKKALQARMSGNVLAKTAPDLTGEKNSALEDIIAAKKRKNPFLKVAESKKCKREEVSSFLDESGDQTLFKLLHQGAPSTSLASKPLTSFENILHKDSESEILVVKAAGESHIPIDWSLKTKIRLWAERPFSWSPKLKISEEASGTTGFVRCLDQNSVTNLDTSPNARFHQCCLYWQQPSLPWLSLFPRTSGKVSESDGSIVTNPTIRRSLQEAWKDSLRSLFQLLRTKQCPYFYVCSNNFTVLFRAAGVGGISDVHALITPTTRGFRHMLKQADVEFSMPLKKSRVSDQGYETLDSAEGADEEEAPDEEWLESMGINADDIKQINYTQAKILHKSECEVDNSEQSLVLVEGVEVLALYNFLINCKSATSPTGPLAGIPPTLLSPVAFNGATLKALKIRESKVHVDNADFHSLEISGPILPNTVHNLFAINPSDNSMSATFVNVANTMSFSKLSRTDDGDDASKRNIIFDKENLSDCGLSAKVLEQFCKSDACVTNVECLKYGSDNKTYTWT